MPISPQPPVRDGGSFDPRPNLVPEEYPGWGGARFNEPALKVTLADGVRDVDLLYVSHAIAGDTLTVRTKDRGYDLTVDLVYRVYPAGLIEKRAVITNADEAARHARERAGRRLDDPAARGRLPPDLRRRPLGRARTS